RLEQDPVDPVVYVVVADMALRTGKVDGVRRDIDRMTSIRIAAVRDLAVLEGQRPREVIVGKDAVSRAVVKIHIAQRDIVTLTPDQAMGPRQLICVEPVAPAAIAVDLEILEDPVIGHAELDGAEL